MRSLRAFLFLCVGLCLGGFSVFAFAGYSDYGRSMKLNGPSGSGARFTGAPIYDWADAPSGWGKMNDINKINIGGKAFDVTGGRLFSPQTLAKGAVSFVRFGGPAWIGFMLAGLVWDEVQQRWLTPSGVPDPVDGVSYWSNGSLMTRCKTAAEKCTWNEVVEEFTPKAWGNAAIQNRAYSRVLGTLYGNTIRAAFTGTLNGKPYEGEFWFSYGGQPHGQDPDMAVADDQSLEDAIYVELVARGMGSDLARRLIEAGYNPPVDGIEIDGPSSIPGDSVTSTTSGPSGTTTSTTNTTHNISYNTNTTNNTSTVTITNTSVTTTTAPDGSTTTETTTEAPPEGAETPPPEEPTPFCEQYPDASACAKLNVPASDPNESESVTVKLEGTGGFGSESGSCPAPYGFVVQGRSYQISYDMACNFFSAVRPVVIAAAMLSALLIALGGYKRD